MAAINNSNSSSSISSRDAAAACCDCGGPEPASSFLPINDFFFVEKPRPPLLPLFLTTHSYPGGMAAGSAFTWTEGEDAEQVGDGGGSIIIRSFVQNKHKPRGFGTESAQFSRILQRRKADTCRPSAVCMCLSAPSHSSNIIKILIKTVRCFFLNIFASLKPYEL
ncbi:hypothetical protein ILYODFUR_026036 [Ilyodon furcidens]|uniref:Uncharacterized protein n=1 Tax=Ilyodon furcidens TaxID=33524 RepID=A0ABV0T098_9TELE